MGVDRGRYSIVNYSNVGIELGTQICTAADLSSNQFTYKGFSFVSTDGGNTWLVGSSIEYAIAPPLTLRKGINNRLYICYQNEDLAVIRVDSGVRLNLSVNEPSFQYTANDENQSGLNVGEPMVNLHGNISQFNYEGYSFEPNQNGTEWTVSPAVTE